MKFYEIDAALQDAIIAAEKPVRLQIQIDTNGAGRFESVFEQDIIEANFYGLKEAAGGTSARGEILIAGNSVENPHPCEFSTLSFCSTKNSS